MVDSEPNSPTWKFTQYVAALLICCYSGTLTSFADALVTKATLKISQRVWTESLSPRALPVHLLYLKANLCNAADIISTVEFDHTGNYLATGDKGGRVVLFERNETVRGASPLPSRMRNLISCCRRSLANTNFTPSSSPMSPNSTISNLWRSRRRSTKSNGAADKMLPTISCLPTIRPSSSGRFSRSH